MMCMTALDSTTRRLMTCGVVPDLGKRESIVGSLRTASVNGALSCEYAVMVERAATGSR